MNSLPCAASHGKASYSNIKSYLIGFILSIILTIIPFIVVIDNSASYVTILTIVISMAIMQVLVHLIYFMHITTSSEECWNLVALVFTTIVIGILVAGSLWIMYNLNINMMVS